MSYLVASFLRNSAASSSVICVEVESVLIPNVGLGPERLRRVAFTLGSATNLPSFLAFVSALKFCIRSLLPSLITWRVTISRYLTALRTIQPPCTRSILRPSLSGSFESGSGPSNFATAESTSSKVTAALRAKFPGAANWQKPSSSIEARRVIHTRIVAWSSSHIEESRIFPKSLLYMSKTVAYLCTLVGYKCVIVTLCHAIRSRIINPPTPQGGRLFFSDMEVMA